MVKTCLNCKKEIEFWDQWQNWCITNNHDSNICEKCGEPWTDV